MRSEEPPSLRGTPPATDTRPKSVPADTLAAAAAEIPKVKTYLTMSDLLATAGSTAAPGPDSQASGQQLITSNTANEGFIDIAGPSDEHTADTTGAQVAQVSTAVKVKAEPDFEATISQTIPAVSSDSLVRQPMDTPAKKEEKTVIDTPSSDLPTASQKITLDNVRKASETTDLAKLKSCIERARQVLDLIRQPLADSKQKEQLDWLNRIDKLRAEQKLRTVVAVAGATGAGKSSLINALLDEEKLLPTSGFRACTAVITEISYNDSQDPEKAYRAEVEFISQDDWDSELELLYGDLVEDKKLSAAYLDTNAEAGIAYAKIRAVYPELTHELILKSKVDELAKRNAVTNVLGKTKEMICSNARDLYISLQKYLDSKDKNTKGGPRKEKDMAFWPLIKVVRVFTRAAALETGVCIVDLPGIHDANAARSAVAKNYMAECSAVWVAAPIKRAVDDEAARKLLGMSSRLQMKLDGIYSSVTFICTMTDSVQLSESVEAFDGDGQIQAALAREDDLEKMIHAKKDSIEKLQGQLNASDEAWQGLEKEFKSWKALQRNQKKGQQVYAPRVPAKRKRTTKPATRGRRRGVVVEDDSDEDDTPDQEPLTADEISSKVTELKAKLASKGAEYDDMCERLETMKNDLKALEHEKKDNSVEAVRLCIQKRNSHVKKCVRVDFSNGIREIDEADAQADDENFDPSIKQRDYEEVGRSLPVFCVSSKAYQQLRLQTKRETRVEGFRDLKDSEVPSLQQHAMKLPEQGRIHVYRTFLNEFYGLLGSLTIWVNSSLLERNAPVMSKQDQSYEEKYLHMAAENLKKDVDVLIWAKKGELDDIIQSNFLSRSNAAIVNAAKEVTDVVSRWTAKKDDGGWGIVFQTYKAICRRDGDKTKSEKSRDFNEDILEPYLKKIVAGWEQAFDHSVPGTLDNMVAEFAKKLIEFHRTMSNRPELEKCKPASIRMLGQKISHYEAAMENEVTSLKVEIQKKQRAAHRAFQPEIQKEMLKAYRLAYQERGTGCFLRMKEHMSTHVRKNKNAIYRKATKRVMDELKKIFVASAKDLKKAAHDIVDKFESDFRFIISSSEIVEAEEVAREHICSVLHKVDTQFEAVLCSEPMEVDFIQPIESVPQQSSIESETGVGVAMNEAADAGSTIEAGAMGTAL